MPKSSLYSMGATYIARLHSTCSSARQPIRAFSNRATRVCPIHSRPYHINHSLTQHKSQRGGQGEAIFISIVSQAQLSEVRISRNESLIPHLHRISLSPSYIARADVTTRVFARRLLLHEAYGRNCSSGPRIFIRRAARRRDEQHLRAVARPVIESCCGKQHSVVPCPEARPTGCPLSGWLAALLDISRCRRLHPAYRLCSMLW